MAPDEPATPKALESVMLADVACETPVHFQENPKFRVSHSKANLGHEMIALTPSYEIAKNDSNIDKSYEWNEWKLRQEALHVADIRRKTTSTTQTALSHLRRENETQVYLPKEMATNTTASRGTNPPRLKKYYTGLRGEPRQMQVAECRYDL
ncbi:CFAP206 [Symbiodinium sp. CCMP2592]|nr:CFAP206 [Symbiodinium sp. CCMP2592]